MYSEDPTLNDCDKWLCGVWARGLSPDAIHMESNLTSAPPPPSPRNNVDNEGSDRRVDFFQTTRARGFNIVLGGGGAATARS